jgi:FAD/FMN-containing dehydrogenase
VNGSRYQSWGRYPRFDQRALPFYWRADRLPVDQLNGDSFLPFGNGRSYGDVCLNERGVLLDCRPLDRFVQIDAKAGILRCESGVLLSEILARIVPLGWFLPVTPGTRFVSLGGAIANDVHGKNHHRAGSFGRHVRRFELLRSDGSRLECSPEHNAEWFAATIGGLGLTGVITWVEIQLQGVANACVRQEVIRYGELGEFFRLARESDESHEHTVAWVDCLARGAKLGRGLFTRANYAESEQGRLPTSPRMRVRFPIDPPFSLVSGPVLKLFNTLYYHRQRSECVASRVHYESFFYPLDAILAWNRVYGARGFFQYQCVVPSGSMEEAVREILERIAASGVGSFLAVLKLLGDRSSPGLLSFPMPGATLALDFPNRGDKTLSLLEQLDEVTRTAGGRLYPAKDARMSAADFQQAYPNWKSLEELRDPQISSSFWRRVTESQ